MIWLSYDGIYYVIVTYIHICDRNIYDYIYDIPYVDTIEYMFRLGVYHFFELQKDTAQILSMVGGCKMKL